MEHALEPSLHFFTVLRRNGIDVTESQESTFREYGRLLLDWNRKINLISRKDEENLWTSHFLHSASILILCPPRKGARLIDIGTGAGLPGIPLAILRSDLQVVLLDSITKKTKAVEEMVSLLGLAGASVVNQRAEEYARSASGAFDVVTARAVAPLEDLVRWSRPFLKHARAGPEGGMLCALKGGDLDREVAAARRRLGPGEIRVVPISFPGSEDLAREDKKLVLVHFEQSL